MCDVNLMVLSAGCVFGGRSPTWSPLLGSDDNISHPTPLSCDHCEDDCGGKRLFVSPSLSCPCHVLWFCVLCLISWCVTCVLLSAPPLVVLACVLLPQCITSPCLPLSLWLHCFPLLSSVHDGPYLVQVCALGLSSALVSVSCPGLTVLLFLF